MLLRNVCYYIVIMHLKKTQFPTQAIVCILCLDQYHCLFIYTLIYQHSTHSKSVPLTCSTPICAEQYWIFIYTQTICASTSISSLYPLSGCNRSAIFERYRSTEHQKKNPVGLEVQINGQNKNTAVFLFFSYIERLKVKQSFQYFRDLFATGQQFYIQTQNNPCFGNMIQEIDCFHGEHD